MPTNRAPATDPELFEAATNPTTRQKPAKVTMVMPLGKLLAAPQATPGITTTALAGQTGGDQAGVLELLNEAGTR